MSGRASESEAKRSPASETKQALACYRRSLELWEDKAEFFKGMEDDWQHLVQYGIGREVYEAVLAELRGE